MSNIIKLPGPKSRRRKRFMARRVGERFDDLCAKIERDADFSDIKTAHDAKALQESDPFRYMLYLASALGWGKSHDD